MAPVRLDHLHNQVIVLTIDVKEQFLFLEGLRVVVRGCGSISCSLVRVSLVLLMLRLMLILRRGTIASARFFVS